MSPGIVYVLYCIITIQSAVSELLGDSNIKEWSSAIGTSREEEEEEET